MRERKVRSAFTLLQECLAREHNVFEPKLDNQSDLYYDLLNCIRAERTRLSMCWLNNTCVNCGSKLSKDGQERLEIELNYALKDDLIHNALTSLHEKIEMLAAAFLKETSLKPSECVLVQRITRDGISFSCERKEIETQLPNVNDCNSCNEECKIEHMQAVNNKYCPACGRYL